MNKPFKIVQADWDEQREQLLAIRYKVFVAEQGVPEELEVDEYDSSALHLLALGESQQAIGTARLLPDGHIGRMAVSLEYRGQGVGSALLRHLIGLSQQAGHRQATLNAQCSAEDFYLQAGFIPVGEVFEDAGIPHRKMICRC